MSIKPADARKLMTSVSYWTIFMTFNCLLLEMFFFLKNKVIDLCSKH